MQKSHLESGSGILLYAGGDSEGWSEIVCAPAYKLDIKESTIALPLIGECSDILPENNLLLSKMGN